MKQNIQVIVQAGGRGSRLRHHTWNKPKCLVPVNGKPILYHAFQTFPRADFIVIGDYEFDVLCNYLTVNPPAVKFKMVKADGHGTSSGIAQALQQVDPDRPLLLMWSDLIFDVAPHWPESKQVIVGTTSNFFCRWSVDKAGELKEISAHKNGIPGLFYFPKASMLPPPPESGEFVKWLAGNLSHFQCMDCGPIQELGDFASVEAMNMRDGFCRFFNKVDIGETQVVKAVVDPAFAELHQKEINWYSEVREIGFDRIPKIYSLNPLTMERIKGKHLFQFKDLTEREKCSVMADYIDTLNRLHAARSVPYCEKDVKEIYFQKTVDRVNSVSQVIPFFKKDVLTINGKKCRNFFSDKYFPLLETVIPRIMPKNFTPIHGDPTFSNTIINDYLKVWFIDPRGYFTKPGIYGDPMYDFAKVYYSAVGNYDNFNRHRFKLYIDSDTAEVLIQDSDISKAALEVFHFHFPNEMTVIQLLHGLIWFSLSGYAKDNIDMIIGAFCLGMYWLEDGMSKL